MIFLFDEQNEPKDIFADIPSEKPVDRPPLSLQSSGSAAPATVGVVRESTPFSKKWVFIPAVILVLGGAAYAAYHYLAPKSPAAPVAAVEHPATTLPLTATPTVLPTEVTPPQDVVPPPAVLNTAPGAASGTPIQPALPEAATSTDVTSSASAATSVTSVDSDGDGLTDAEEVTLGTNPNNPDTDGDGLTDYQEVCIYGTNSLNPDTDGDGYKDGEEVQNGYNPNGPGKMTVPLPTISNAVCQRAPSPTTP
jgi:hypothetical protein